MKKFLKVVGFIVLMFAALFGGEFMRDIGLGDPSYIFLGLFALCAYYMNEYKEQIAELQQGMEKAHSEIKQLKDRAWLLEHNGKGQK
jgi:hypothetical protein